VAAPLNALQLKTANACKIQVIVGFVIGYLNSRFWLEIVQNAVKNKMPTIWWSFLLTRRSN